MGSGASIPLDKHIVIVGGGYAGIKVALKLMEMDANFTLIDVKDCFTHNVANVRAVVEPDITPKMYIDYATTFRGFFRRGRVSGIDTTAQEVLLDDGSKVSYDVLILGTGCTGEFPAKCWDKSKEQAVTMFTEYAHKVQQASRIAIVGGGAVGVEIAAEIATDYKDKEVTLFHPGKEMLRPGLRQKTQQTLQNILSRMGIKLVLGEKVTNLSEVLGDSSPFTLQTSDGQQYEADLVIPCIGAKVNSTAFQQGLEESMEKNGALMVNEQLQVKGHDNIFAMGDCTNVKEMKLVLTAENQADVVLHNLIAMLQGRNMKVYKPDSIPIKVVVSLGRSSGIGETKQGFILPEFLVARLKSGHMFIDKLWTSMKQTPPK